MTAMIRTFNHTLRSGLGLCSPLFPFEGTSTFLARPDQNCPSLASSLQSPHLDQVQVHVLAVQVSDRQYRLHADLRHVPLQAAHTASTHGRQQAENSGRDQ